MNAIDGEYVQLQIDFGDYLVGGGKIAAVKAPPGSGKTHLLIDVLAKLVTEGQRVAVAAQINSQADDMYTRLSARHPGDHGLPARGAVCPMACRRPCSGLTTQAPGKPDVVGRVTMHT